MSLAGDFLASFQLSAGTLNRLLASMHQNDGGGNTRSLPHSARLRIGEEGAEGVPAGLVSVQIGVPQIKLVYGSTDRFGIDVMIRAHYEADVFADPLAEFIRGTVTAEYELIRPDPSWRGWGGVDPARYLAARVVDGSVGFTGKTATGWEPSHPAVDAGDLAPRIANTVADLLRTSFQASPIPADRLGPGRLRSLGSAVAGPLDPGSAGRIESLDEEWLYDYDVGMALSSRSMLEQMKGRLHDLNVEANVNVDFGVDDEDYKVTVSTGDPVWAASGDRASITVRIAASATCDSDWFPDVSASVVQRVDLTVDAALKSFVLTPAAPYVDADVSGLLGGALEGVAREKVAAFVGERVSSALQLATAALNRFLDGRETLRAALHPLDGNVGVYLNAAEFRDDGVAVRGTIIVTPRAEPVVTFSATSDRTAFTALETWIPGGQVNKLIWRWEWPIDIAAEPGTEQETKARYTDRFLLRGPLQYPMSRAEFPYHGPLPGLDGDGGVILGIRGDAVNEQTGELKPLKDIPAKAIGFGYTFFWEVPLWAGELYWTEDLELLVGGHPHPHELGLGVLRRPLLRSGGWSSNTLVVTQGQGPTRETLDTLEVAVAGHDRPEAGLLTVTVFHEGGSAGAGEEVVAQLGRLRAERGVPLVVAETGDAALWDGLALPRDGAEPSYRLISPSGGVTWSHDGALSSDQLVTALNSTLMPSPQPLLEAVTVGPAPGTRLWEAADDVGVPAPPLGRHRDGPRLVVFADSRSSVSVEQVRKVDKPAKEAGERVAYFVNGDPENVEALNSQLDDPVDAIPDPGGVIARRLGITCWPTTLKLDADGVVVDSWLGDPPRVDDDEDDAE